MTVRYELQVHSRDVLTSSEYDKHTGYDLIKYVDDMPIQIQSIDLYNYNGQIKYDIRTQVVAQDLYESTGEIVGSFMFYDGVPVAVTAEWLAEMQYCVSEPLLINGSAVQAFNKIKLEATILNQLTNDLNYNIVWRNCNTSTNYFAQQYVNGQNVFATLPVGEYIGSSFSFYDPNSTSTTDITIKAVRNIIDKYYSLVGTNVDLSNVNYGVVNQSDALYAKFTTDDYNYVFAGNGEANIVDIYGDSFIYADAGNHTINAGNGNDVIYGREANVIDGGDGNDIIYAGDQTYAAHSIGAGTGDDYIYAGHGGDDVRGGNGNNTVYLGSGSDKYIGGDDVDIVDGGSQDFIFTDSVDSSFKYNLSADLSGDINTIHLGGGADEYKGGTGADIVYGGEDNDIIRGGDGENKLYGENGDDILIGGAGNDYLVGGNGNDIIYGYGGNNELNGDAGNDYIYGGDNADTIHGGDGDDYIRGYNGDNWLYGDAGNDNIYGQSDNDNLYGGTGADYLSPGTGNNFIDCGADNHMDMVRINNGANGVDTIVNATGSDYILCSGGFNMSSMEQVGNDIIIYGNRGNKIIIKDIKLPEERIPGLHRLYHLKTFLCYISRMEQS